MRVLQASVLTSLADNLITAGDLHAAADRRRAQANDAMTAPTCRKRRSGARLNFQAARIALQSGDIRPVGRRWPPRMTYQKAARSGSIRSACATCCSRNGDFTERVADLLYAEVLREPTRARLVRRSARRRWRSASRAAPAAVEHWLEIARIARSRTRP